jgi:nitrogen regulatory protein P-II 1
MNYLVTLIVDDPENCTPVLDAWEALSVPGVTILESSGLGRHRRAGLRDDLPLIPRLQDFFDVREEPHRTLLSVVDSQEMVDRMVEAVQAVIGNLDDPHTGFLYVTPVLQAYGLGRAKK